MVGRGNETVRDGQIKKCMCIHATGENFKLSMFIQVLNDQTLSLEIPDLHVPDLT